VLSVAAHQIYEIPQALPRFFLVPRIRVTQSLTESIAVMGSREFDPRRMAVVEGATALTGGVGEALPLDAVNVTYYGQRGVALEVDAPVNAFLVTSEASYPGWRGFVDDRELKLYMTNGAFRGIFVPAGRHRVEMRFQPDIRWYSMAISALAWCALFVGVFQRRLAEHRFL
jgi:hypothetical protein